MSAEVLEICLVCEEGIESFERGRTWKYVVCDECLSAGPHPEELEEESEELEESFA